MQVVLVSGHDDDLRERPGLKRRPVLHAHQAIDLGRIGGASTYGDGALPTPAPLLFVPIDQHGLRRADLAREARGTDPGPGLLRLRSPWRLRVPASRVRHR